MVYISQKPERDMLHLFKNLLSLLILHDCRGDVTEKTHRYCRTYKLFNFTPLRWYLQRYNVHDKKLEGRRSYTENTLRYVRIYT